MFDDDVVISFDYIWYILLGLFIIVFDQFFKYMAVTVGYFGFSLFSCEIAPIINHGLIFGFLESQMLMIRFLLITCTSALFISVCKMAKRRYALGHKIYPEMLILAGGASNLLDRFTYGGVIDFFTINFLLKNFYVVGNCADLCIFLGILYLFFWGKDVF